MMTVIRHLKWLFLKKKKVSYQKVPLDTLFKMKIIDGSNVRKLKYNLGKDTELPCEKVVGGKSKKVNSI